MPSETDAMDSVSKEEEDTEKSNEQSVALMTLNSTNQESVKHTDTHLANTNGDKVSTSDVRTKFFNSTEDTASTASDSSVTTNDLLEAENLCPQDKTTGNVIAELVNTLNLLHIFL